MVADEVHDGEVIFAHRRPKSPPELLEEHDRRLGRPQQEYGVNVWRIEAFVEKVDGENNLEHPVPQLV